MDKKRSIEELILAIEELKDEDTNSLIIEELSLFTMDDLKVIEAETNLKIFNGRKVLIFFIPLILNMIYKALDEDIKKKEVVIIGDDEELTKKLIESLCKDIRFITVTGDYEEDEIENIYEYILEETGLSIFYSKNIDRILTNYSIVINLIDNYYFNCEKLRDEAIIFDFSINKQFSNSIKRNRKAVVIEDFIFEGDDLKIEDTEFISSLFSSCMYEKLNQFKLEDFIGLFIEEQIYKIKDFADYKIKNKRKM